MVISPNPTVRGGKRVKPIAQKIEEKGDKLLRFDQNNRKKGKKTTVHSHMGRIQSGKEEEKERESIPRQGRRGGRNHLSEGKEGAGKLSADRKKGKKGRRSSNSFPKKKKGKAPKRLGEGIFLLEEKGGSA